MVLAIQVLSLRKAQRCYGMKSNNAIPNLPSFVGFMLLDLKFYVYVL